MEGIPTRMGDGSLVRMTRAEIEADIHAGVEAGAKRAKVEPLGDDEIAHLLDIFASRARFSAVDIGDEVILTSDGAGSQDAGSRINDLQIYEQIVCTDTVELYHHDYSFKAVKPILPYEQETMRQAQLLLTVPLRYGAMPDLGRYTSPTGRAQLVGAAAAGPHRRGARGPGRGRRGSPPRTSCTSPRACTRPAPTASTSTRWGRPATPTSWPPSRRSRHPRPLPGLGIQFGMASEFVLGMHGELEYDGVRLAGLWPPTSCGWRPEAGATVFGPAINVNTGKTLAWNSARALTIVKPCMAAATIPVHLNVGMGVGGVPMHVSPPLDAVSRASRACVDILQLDGL